MDPSSRHDNDARGFDQSTPPAAVTFASPMIRRAEAKLDEGYSGGSEETRSLSDSDTNMQLDVDDDHDMSKSSDLALNRILELPPEERAAFVASLILGLPESERSDTAYAALRSLRTSSIASIVERLNPLLHLDPVIHLPPEITAHIFLHLSPADLLKSSAASKQWRERALDGNLWRTFFGREGWASNRDEMKWTEGRESRRRLAASRNAAQKATRRKPEGELERSSSIKRQRESNGQLARLRQAAGRAEEWSEQHGTLEADDDMVMGEAGSLETSPNAVTEPVDHHSSSATVAHSEDPHHSSFDVHGANVCGEQSTMSPSLRPALFTSNIQSPRINWLYLFKQRRRLEENWNKGRYATFQLPHPEHLDEAHDECVYTIQHSRKWLVSGSRDKTIAIWDLDTQRRVRTLAGAHTASVLCLQFDERPNEDIVVSGGSDSLVIIWKFSTGRVIRKMDEAHAESVLNLRFDHRYLITCSKDKTIKIWNRNEVFLDDPIVPAVARRQLELGGMNPINEYTLLTTLEGHGAAVNAIQVFHGQIVSASGDRTIKAWDINTGNCIKTYTGHTKGIACVQFDGRRIVSGSSDNTVRIFDAATSAEVACLQGHSNLVRTVQARFGDMHDTGEDLEAAARAVDESYYDARRSGHGIDQQRRRGVRNAGSSHPNDVCAIGAKIPPGGGGNVWSRIVSGSYDETVIIWKKDLDGKWMPTRRLRQDEILHPRTRRPRQNVPQAPVPHPAPLPAAAAQVTPQQLHQAHQQTTSNDGAGMPTVASILASGQLPQANIGQVQTFTASLVALTPSSSAQTTPNNVGAGAASVALPPPPVTQNAANHHHHHGQHPVPANVRARDESNRVFKLQFDSRRIVSCSQNRIIVGWDFAAGDPDLEEASRFFDETH